VRRNWRIACRLCVSACVYLDESGNSYAPLCGQGFAMEFDALKLMQRLGSEIALPAVWATDNRHVFDDEQVRPFAVTSGQVADFGPILATNIADHSFSPYSR
jgi:hypothetical protein